MGKVQMAFRLTLGGTLCGCLLGTPVGGILGVSLGYLLANNPSLGLDGALVGGALVGLAGGVYGFLLALTPEPSDSAAMNSEQDHQEMTVTRR